MGGAVLVPQHTPLENQCHKPTVVMSLDKNIRLPKVFSRLPLIAVFCISTKAVVMNI